MKHRKKQTVPHCAHCRRPVSWDNIEWVENPLSAHGQERIYYCPHCGTIIEFSYWHTVG